MPRMTGSRYFAEAMRGYGVTSIFYVNSIARAALEEAGKLGIGTIVTHGEKAAAYMADGYARARHRPGICLCQDIGSTNLAAGLRDARMSGSPVIAISGGQNDEPRYRHAYQNAEDNSAWEGVTKANFCVNTVKRFPDLLRQAFRTATSGAPGPVHLELRGNAGQVLDAEADLPLVFEKRFARFPAFRPLAEPEAVKAAVDALRKAAKPIIVVGGGAVKSGAGAELIRLAETLQVPIATSLHARALVSDDHALNVGVPGSYSRWCANQAVAAADLVFFIGSHAGGQVTNGWQIPKAGTPVIQLDIDPDELGRNYPNIVSLHGDAKVALRQMIDAAGNGPSRRAEWLEQVRSQVADFWKESDPLRTSDAVPIRPERIAKELGEWLPSGATLVVDTFHAAIWTAQMSKLTKPGQRYLRCGGSLGWSFPATLGAKAALGDEPVIGFCGDAGFYYHMAELETAARAKLNAVMVVNNNHSGGVIEDARFEREVNFAKVAESMGCAGFRVEKPAGVKGALDKALAAGRPAVVEILSDAAIRAKRGWVPSGVSGE
ncbi:MAG: thiamine pyrophosphate-binding protein [Burkholderiales bacterium]|nr:thiamine pyrophosphate-binding protein [Burkholderiales bacterium]